jgi:hypothetical protein
MKLLTLALFPLCLLACIEYSETIELHSDGSATYFASTYAGSGDGEPDSAYYFNALEKDYDSVWFEKKDSFYTVNVKLHIDNLLGKKEIKDLGYFSLKKIDSLKNGYSFERIINPNVESEDGEVIPEENIPQFILEEIQNDSIYWEYSLVLPPEAMLISSDPIDTSYINNKSNTLRWKFPINEAVSQRIAMKADFTLPAAQKNIPNASVLGVIAGCIIMLLAIIFLMRKLKKLSLTLRDLKTLQSQHEPENESAQDDSR